MRIDFVTLFPSVALGAVRHGVIARAEDSGKVAFGAEDPRDYCYDRHRKVDDTPYGGEPGMLMKAEPVALATEACLRRSRTHARAVILTAPTGTRFDQKAASSLAKLEHLVFLCGHYEGIDHRVEEEFATHVFSVGDFVLTNGEIPAAMMADAVVRLLPGVLGSAGSLEADSHTDGLLSAPNYTKPAVWRGRAVPDVLLGGNHEAVATWRRRQSLTLTYRTRPDLLAQAALTFRDCDALKVMLEGPLAG